ncbi:GntR family transcriptional regulator [Streptomyces sp. NRRL F-5123]|uniref:GntR family transcriptional regulator n=1 Tax=Streptomyces sp. NRRL F-5123 TaxID=1463856 RepID=UPI0004E18EAB|nr:GntR family transcriptional regulator [Streptomyces sp. NRRL F-5123]
MRRAPGRTAILVEGLTTKEEVSFPMADAQSNAGMPAAPLPEGAPPAGVIHVRHRHADRFTVVGNHLAQHPDLSAVAIGLAVHIQSLPDGAPVSVKALAARFPEGEITVRRALNELQAAGYLERRRVPLGGGRFATRAFAYDRPGGAAASGPGRRTGRASRPAVGRTAGPGGVGRTGPGRTKPSRPAPAGAVPVTSRQPPAAELLARLRLADPRLLLSAGDIARLAPAVETWLGRAVPPAEITRVLSAGLPPSPTPIHAPSRFLAHRLAVHLPPPLPPEPVRAPRPAPLRTCDGCERAFRTEDPTARCADCRGSGGGGGVAGYA